MLWSQNDTGASIAENYLSSYIEKQKNHNNVNGKLVQKLGYFSDIWWNARIGIIRLKHIFIVRKYAKHMESKPN